MHHKLSILADNRYVVRRGRRGPPPIAPAGWEPLACVDWKSGGDTSFAPLASATGDMDCRGLREHATPDKRGIWTSNRQLAPGLADYTERIGATIGRSG